eukprot:1369079-Amorphochlora_amoeboformis.AAC.1
MFFAYYASVPRSNLEVAATPLTYRCRGLRTVASQLRTRLVYMLTFLIFAFVALWISVVLALWREQS